MNIEDSFDTDVIRRANVALDVEDEETLEKMLKYTLDQMDGVGVDQAVNLAALAFVAGRCYQVDENQHITVDMSPDLASAFMEFLAGRMM